MSVGSSLLKIDHLQWIPIELIGNRDTATVADWLLRHPTVTVIARDQAGGYSDAVQSAAPAAQQVADRWHPLSNLRG